jgi:hypothetical protein
MFEMQQSSAMDRPNWNEGRLLRSEMRDGFARIDERFDQLTRFLLVAALAIVVALIGAPHI